MINTNKLKGRIAEMGLSQSDLAKKINIAPKTFYEKMKKGVFTNLEIEKMAKVLKIENIVSIFFTD